MTITFGPDNTPLQPTSIEELYDRMHCEQAFKKAMEGCQYGEDETRDALAWFRLGWNARNIPAKKEIPGRYEFMEQEDELKTKAYNSGWNDCRAEMLK